MFLYNLIYQRKYISTRNKGFMNNVILTMQVMIQKSVVKYRRTFCVFLGSLLKNCERNRYTAQLCYILMLSESQNLEKFHCFEGASNNIWFWFKFFIQLC